jgi:hypothetical protein
MTKLGTLIMWEEKSDTKRSRMVSYFIYWATAISDAALLITETKLAWADRQIDAMLADVLDR